MGSNHRPEHYECSAPPTELKTQNIPATANAHASLNLGSYFSLGFNAVPDLFIHHVASDSHVVTSEIFPETTRVNFTALVAEIGFEPMISGL